MAGAAGGTVRLRLRLAPMLADLGGAAPRMELELGDGATVRDVLDELRRLAPGVERRVRDEQGALRRHVNVFVGTDNVRDLSGLSTPVPTGAEVTVLPAISGG